MKSKDESTFSITHSSAAEYLAFVTANGGSEGAIEMRYKNENIWLTQKIIGQLYGVSIAAINRHIKKSMRTAS